MKFRYNGAPLQSIFGELLAMLDKLTAELKSDLDPENDRIGLSLEHPDFGCQVQLMCHFNDQKI